MRKLFLIPARGGSKGLPRKNILPLAGRPMIHYTIDAAKGAMQDGDELCVSTEDDEIIQVVENYGIRVPFVRPLNLAADDSGSEEVIRHAVDWYKSHGQNFDLVVLLQVTSPLRNAQHVKEALALWSNEADMILSVKETKANPYYVLFEEDSSGFLKKSKESNLTRRQDCPIVYELNGAIYIYPTKYFQNRFNRRSLIKKYVMDEVSSIDIDSLLDFRFTDFILEQKKNTSDRNL